MFPKPNNTCLGIPEPLVYLSKPGATKQPNASLFKLFIVQLVYIDADLDLSLQLSLLASRPYYGFWFLCHLCCSFEATSFFIVKSILPLEINLNKFVCKIIFKVFYLLNIKPKSVRTLEKTSCTKSNDIVFEYTYHSVILNLPYCFHCI